MAIHDRRNIGFMSFATTGYTYQANMVSIQRSSLISDEVTNNVNPKPINVDMSSYLTL
jgi:hypothetical protein